MANIEGSGDDLRTSEHLGVEGVTEKKNKSLFWLERRYKNQDAINK